MKLQSINNSKLKYRKAKSYNPPPYSAFKNLKT